VSGLTNKLILKSIPIKRLKYATPCGAAWALAIFLFLTPVKGFAYTPVWIQTHLDGTLQIPGVYHGASFATYKGNAPDYAAMRLAKDRALDELCYGLSVSLKSKFENRIVEIGDYEEQQITSSLFVSTRKVLSGVEEKENWRDSKRHRYWVLVTIDRKKADRQLQEQKFINEVVDRLENKQEEILKGIKKISLLLNQNMQLYADRMQHFDKLLVTIDKKVSAAGVETKNEYGYIREEIKKLEQNRRKQSERMESIRRVQGQQMAELMYQNKMLQDLLSQISGKIQQDYFLALTDDDVKRKETTSKLWVEIKPQKGQGADYYAGEKIRFRVRTSRGCYIKVIYLTSLEKNRSNEKRMNILLFPNKHDRDNWIRAGETKVIGKHGELEIQPPFGKDVVTVVASEKQFTDVEENLKQAAGNFYSTVTGNTRDAIRVRGMGVVTPATSSDTGSERPSVSGTVATDTCFIVSRPR
jgi:hypothetical protein